MLPVDERVGGEAAGAGDQDREVDSEIKNGELFVRNRVRAVDDEGGHRHRDCEGEGREAGEETEDKEHRASHFGEDGEAEGDLAGEFGEGRGADSEGIGEGVFLLGEADEFIPSVKAEHKGAYAKAKEENAEGRKGGDCAGAEEEAFHGISKMETCGRRILTTDYADYADFSEGMMNVFLLAAS